MNIHFLQTTCDYVVCEWMVFVVCTMYTKLQNIELFLNSGTIHLKLYYLLLKLKLGIMRRDDQGINKASNWQIVAHL